MGLFSFLKKKENDQSSTLLNQDKIVSSQPVKAAAKVEAVQQSSGMNSDGIIPLSVLMKVATPTKQGLYPHEILMLEYAPTYKTTNNAFQQFWYYQYSVKDPQVVLESLYERGFIVTGDLRSALEKQKLSDIKEELKFLNQKATGKKAELIERLLENGELDTLNNKYSERYFVLTEKGKQEVKENEYVSYLHKNRYMTVWEMNQKIAETHLPYRDIIWDDFNQEASLHFKNFDFGLYRNTRLNMYRFLMEEKEYEVALDMLCEVLSFDLSGLGNSEKSLFEWEKTDPKLYLTVFESRIESYFPYEETTLIIPPGIISFFKNIQSELDLNDEEFEEAILMNLKKVKMPKKIFTDKECVNIIMASMHEDESILSSIYADAEKREKAKLQNIKDSIK